MASSVSEILQLADVLKGNDWVDPEDPTVIAENELLGAASAIESAAKKLSVLKPRTKTEVVKFPKIALKISLVMLLTVSSSIIQCMFCFYLKNNNLILT